MAAHRPALRRGSREVHREPKPTRTAGAAPPGPADEGGRCTRSIGLLPAPMPACYGCATVAADDVMALAMPEQMVAALERQIDVLPTRADAMPVTEQIRRVAELEATVLD